MSKIEAFRKELNLINDPAIRTFTVNMLEKLPDYFFTTGASSTGKYHPKFAAGEGGLVRHTRAAVRIAHEMLRNDMFKAFQNQADEIYSALILHDGAKHGLEGSKYTVTKHPLIVCDLIKEEATDNENGTPEFVEKVCGLIASHMGQWNYDYKTKVAVLPKPENKLQNFVHLCDYLASRSCIGHDFDADLSS